MTNDVRELVVFMASPSDLVEERDRIRRLGDELNANFESTGVGVRIAGWETVQPEFGRPQSLINPRVHECDVFIGILRRRWGSPTGEYSSGFEEEFNIAVGRRMTSPKPAIGLYFAELTAEEREDPGKHLTRVLTFRERIQREHVGLYREFRSADHLESQILSFLTPKLLDLIDITASTRADLGPVDPPGAPEAATAVVVQDVDLDSAREQLSTALHRLDAIVRGDTTDYTFDRDRISLMAAAFGQDDDPLGTHLVNRLYMRRGELALSVGEHEAWTRTLFNDIGTSAGMENRTVPGWGALQAVDPRGKDFDEEILRWAADGNRAVAQGAMRSIVRLERRPAALAGSQEPQLGTNTAMNSRAAGGTTEADPQEFANADATGASGASGAEAQPHEQAPEDARARALAWVKLLNALPGLSATLNYLIRGYSEDRVLLDAIAGEESLNDESREVVDAVLASLEGDFSKIAARSPSASSPDGTGITKLLIRHVDALKDEDVNRLACDNYNMPLRLAALRVGLKRRLLTKATLLHTLKSEDRLANDLLVDTASSDTPFGLSLLTIIAKEKLSLLETPDLEPRLMALCYTADELRALDESNEYSTDAWEALTYLLSDDMVSEAREVLDTDAAVFRQRIPEHPDLSPSLARYIVQGASRAAADLLSRSTLQTVEDRVRVARAVQRSSSVVRPRELIALARVSTPEMQALITETIATISAYSFVSDIHALMSTALGPALSAHFHDSDIPQLRTAARQWYFGQPERTEAELREAVYDGDSPVRMTALSALLTRLDRPGLEHLLEVYPRSERPFWYNIVARLDEHLYANQAGGHPADD